MTESLPDGVRKYIGDQAGAEIFEKSILESFGAGISESIAYVRAWNELVFKGYEQGEDGVFRRRCLIRHDDKTSKIPFPQDGEIMGRLRPDQVPRFLGALTNPENLEDKTVSFSELTAVQNRVSTEKIDALVSSDDRSGPAGVVARVEGKMMILDGHHRITARWLSGDDSVLVKYINLMPLSNAMKSDGEEKGFSFSQNILKIDSELKVVYGWASVVEQDGIPVIDSQRDHISPEQLVRAAHDFIKSSRSAKLLHEGEEIGEVVESIVMTKDVQAALGIDLKKVGWFIGIRVLNDKVWGAVKDGRLKMFSIGGRAERIDRV